MERQELVAHARSQIDQLKVAGVPKLMREKNVEALEKILEGFDYSAYEDCIKPGFKLEELHLADEEDIYATVFYIWGNPYLEGGDWFFFINCHEFGDLLEEQEDSYLSETLYNLLYEEGISLTQYCEEDWEADGLTIEQLLGLEEVE